MGYVKKFKDHISEDDIDKAWWIGENKGRFIVRSIFNNLSGSSGTKKGKKNWIKGHLFKIVFFIREYEIKRVFTNNNVSCKWFQNAIIISMENENNNTSFTNRFRSSKAIKAFYFMYMYKY